MGDYNPHFPYIIGQEWVPIQQRDIEFTPGILSREVGYGFTIPEFGLLDQAAVYINSISAFPGSARSVVNVYRADALTTPNPVRQVVIPCSSAATTGSGITVTTTGVTLELNISQLDGATRMASVQFAVDGFLPLLTGKRILKLEFQYAGFVETVDANGIIIPYANPPGSSSLTRAFYGRSDGSNLAEFFRSYEGDVLGTGQLDLVPYVSTTNNVQPLVEVGNRLRYINLTQNIGVPATEGIEWNVGNIARFGSSFAGSRRNITMWFLTPTVSDTFFGASLGVSNMALVVTYCDETRTAFGNTTTSDTGQRRISLADTTGFTGSVQFEPGQYYVTMTQYPSDIAFFDTTVNAPSAKYNAIRELEQLPTLPGVEIRFPTLNHDGTEKLITVHESNVLPQISLFNAGFIFQGTHAYGRQAQAQIYGRFTAAQIIDASEIASVNLEQIRFYARRYGHTSVPLTVSVDGGVYLGGESGDFVGAAEDYDITGDIDLRADVFIPSWLGGVKALISKYEAGANEISYVFYVAATGHLALEWSANGSTGAGTMQSTVPIDPPTGRLAVRVAFDVNNGAGGKTATFYTASDVNGVWSQLGDPDTQAGTTTIFAGDAVTELGSFEAGTLGTWEGIFYAAQIYDGIYPNGDLLADPIFWGETPDQDNIIDSFANEWNLEGTFFLQGLTWETLITPAEFDALELVTTDGWKEITLQFDENVPTIGTDSFTDLQELGIPWFPTVRWSAIGENAQNRWEILATTAPAVSGSFDGSQVLVPTNMHPKRASYGTLNQGLTPSGETVQLGWLPHNSPYVSGFMGDPSSDATVFFSQTPPEVTGFELFQLSQEITGIGQNCGVDPCCIPTEIYYNQLAWSLPNGTNYVLQDLFERTEEDTWGSPTVGPAYSSTSTTALSVHDDRGFIDTRGILSSSESVDLAPPGNRYDFTATIRNEGPDSHPAFGYFFKRSLTTDTFLNIFIEFFDFEQTVAAMNFLLESPAGTLIIADAGTVPFTVAQGSSIRLRLMVDGDIIKIKVWRPIDDEPPMWTIESDAQIHGMYLDGSAGTRASTPDNAALDITGDFDLRANITMFEWASGGFHTILAKYDEPTNHSYALVVRSDGTLGLTVSANGTADISFVSTDPVPLESGRAWVRAVFDADDGAGNSIAYFYMGTTAENMTALGDPVINATGPVTIFNSTASLEAGALDNGAGALLNGIIHYVELRNGIDGTIVADPHFDEQVDGDTSFVDDAGRTWTLNSDAFIYDPNDPVNDNLSLVLNTNPRSVLSYDDLILTPPRYWFGYYEIQRRDTVETDWQTIMKATSPAVTGFNDYEARVGIISEYRIRTVNVHGFVGPWSPTVSGMIPEPGVGGDSDCLTGGKLLIFTTNEQQDGAYNLAYSMAWLGQQVEEAFVFPESSFVQMQAMYDRDFYTAFRPLERGGETFERTVLVQAAAISPETLADFKSLRDMAWATVNYICVRDEDGNRWLATVQVPSGNVIRNRRLYLAPVQITEVTETPTPVDPSPWS